MSEPSSKQDQPLTIHAPRTGAGVFRFGIVLSAVTFVFSLFSGLGTHIINKLSGAQQASVEQAQNDGLQPYESPSFHLFDSVFVGQAQAINYINATSQ